MLQNCSFFFFFFSGALISSAFLRVTTTKEIFGVSHPSLFFFSLSLDYFRLALSALVVETPIHVLHLAVTRSVCVCACVCV